MRVKQGEDAIRIEDIPLDDKPSFDLLRAAKTTAVFQLESHGMKELIKRLQPDVFEDIIALVALYRPGPLQSGMVDDFVNRKKGIAKVTYPHPDLEPLLNTNLRRYRLPRTGNANRAGAGRLFAGWRGYVASCDG